jgi:carboxypeptidase Taq
MSREPLREEIAAINDLLCAASILVWDLRTVMPAGGTEARGRQIATLTGAARERLLAPATERALEAAVTAVQAEPADSAARREVEAVAEAIGFHRRVPADLGARRSCGRLRAQPGSRRAS